MFIFCSFVSLSIYFSVYLLVSCVCLSIYLCADLSLWNFWSSVHFFFQSNWCCLTLFFLSLFLFFCCSIFFNFMGHCYPSHILLFIPFSWPPFIYFSDILFLYLSSFSNFLLSLTFLSLFLLFIFDSLQFQVMLNMTTSNVVTMEYVPGIKINDIKRIEEAGIDRQLLAKRSAEAYLTQLCRHGFFRESLLPLFFFFSQNKDLEILIFVSWGALFIFTDFLLYSPDTFLITLYFPSIPIDCSPRRLRPPPRQSCLWRRIGRPTDLLRLR